LASNSHTIVTKILEISHQDPDVLKELDKFRRSVAVLFTDLDGSTAYYEKFGDLAGFAMVHECNDLLRQVVEEHSGCVVKNIGDAIMARFDNCEQAVRAPIAMQRRLREVNLRKNEEDRSRVRIGVHYGPGIVKSDDVFGDVVNVASRIESVASPEQILISDSLSQEVTRFGFDICCVGQFKLKGKSQARHLYEVGWDQESSPTHLNLGHTVVSSAIPTAQAFKIQHLDRQQKVDDEHSLFGQGLTIGRTEGDLKFPDDSSMHSPHAQFFVQNGQPMVEDLSQKGAIFLRLKGVFTLEANDIIVIGGQLFRFEAKPEIVAAATTVGIAVPEVSRMLNQSPAEFVRLNTDSPGQQKRLPLSKEEVRFGRSTGDYTFPEDRLMSRAHARVYLRGEDHFLEDLRSLNGTFVKVRGQMPVPLGASVRVGKEVFVVV